MTTSFENQFGGLLLTVLISMIFYGVTTTQAYVYWWHYPDDSKFVRALVVCIWVVETVHSALSMHEIYTYLILDYGHATAVEMIVWSIGARYLLEVCAYEFNDTLKATSSFTGLHGEYGARIIHISDLDVK
ncbi:hypothetical protein AcW1_010073 [Taiwanofungus camphoratus]|nr:hypothetical protein AcW1_010073 [Antrodia cinnamomea]KAI0946674.1 hypothetical protein AcW1_010073 [Antrodia cinnamomea]KAI0954187.1 hypothetical protein AcV7_007488 [Antrodia cinnamomea]